MDEQHSLDFAEHAQRIVEAASMAPWRLRDGRTVVPRVVLADLAEVAVEAPITGREIDYTQTLRECFDALAAKDHGGDPELHILGLMLALMSMDRGGFVPQANACENALQYMASLRAWREVGITFGGASA
ncbi:hypothetical protein OG948_59925 (plasmid) [Embleya sp. NBC_00888]|uniref:hypothetical protein n=1 Tax=Embleya sp. NBC_00888 TaxID=2975960 RepID=UPI002F90D437|nr:hypothetical protein OG948_59925 [Embleya sp. NBC_00888]